VSDDYVDCWFIGGPWDNQLMKVHRNHVARHQSICAPIVPKMAPIKHMEELIRHDDVKVKTVTYHLSWPLKTGVPVYSSLDIY
jgi:hypothetical protein